MHEKAGRAIAGDRTGGADSRHRLAAACAELRACERSSGRPCDGQRKRARAAGVNFDATPIGGRRPAPPHAVEPSHDPGNADRDRR
jgi:hypothetical protein